MQWSPVISMRTALEGGKGGWEVERRGWGGVGIARLLEEERVRRLFRIHELMRYAGVLILINPINSKCTNLKIREKNLIL